MDEYKSNSNSQRSKDESERRIAPVVSGATIQKKSGFGKFADSIIVTSLDDLGSWLLSECVIPWIKKGLYDLGTNTIDMLLYGKNGSPKQPSSNITKVSYGNFYNKSYNSSDSSVKTTTSSSLSMYNFDNIIYPTRGDAEAALSALDDIMEEYKVVSVSDLYEVSDLPTPSYTANNYGWLSLRSAEVFRHSSGGYIIKLPPVTEINKRR